MEEEIRNLLNCGYYDEYHDYIVELNEEKMKDFFHIFFKADKVIFANKDMEKLKYDADKMAHEIIEEQNKKYNELKENSKILIKTFAEIL